MENAARLHPENNPLGYEKVSKLIQKFTLPAIVSMLVTAIYNMVDQIFIGQGIGMLGIAATNVAFPNTIICAAAALLFGIGGASGFNLSLGAKEKEKASFIAGNTITLLAISGIVIMVLTLVFLEPMLVFFGATPAVLPYAIPYMAITAPGIPFAIFFNGACKLIRADGSPNVVMFCMLAGAVFNVIFDPIFLFVFDMGIQGIALATTLGQLLSFIICVWYLKTRFQSTSLEKKYFKLHAPTVWYISALGMASAFNQMAIMVVQITMNNVMRFYGSLSAYGSDIPLAAVGAISKLGTIFMSFTIGIAQGSQPIHSYNYGAKNYARVKSALKISMLSASAISLFFFLIFQLFPRQLMAIFGENDPLFLQFSVRYMRIFMMMTFVNGIQPVTANFFTSIGKAKKGILISLTRQIILLLPMVLLLSFWFGIDGIMYAGPIADTAAFILSAFLVAQEVRQMTAKENFLALAKE